MAHRVAQNSKFLKLIKISISAAEIVNESDSPSYWDSRQPYFDNTTNRDIVSTVGQSAILKCYVRNLGDRAVRIPKKIL